MLLGCFCKVNILDAQGRWSIGQIVARVSRAPSTAVTQQLTN